MLILLLLQYMQNCPDITLWFPIQYLFHVNWSRHPTGHGLKTLVGSPSYVCEVLNSHIWLLQFRAAEEEEGCWRRAKISAHEQNMQTWAKLLYPTRPISHASGTSDTNILLKNEMKSGLFLTWESFNGFLCRSLFHIGAQATGVKPLVYLVLIMAL